MLACYTYSIQEIYSARKVMACAYSTIVVNRCLSLTAENDALMRAIRDDLSRRTGRATYVSAVVYGLTLAAAHLGIEAPDPLPLPPVEPRRQR